MDLKQIFGSVSQALSTLDFKSKNKTELVDIANGLLLTSNCNKEGLINGITKKLSQLIMTEFKAQHYSDISVPNLMAIMQSKNTPRNMQPMLKEIFIESRRNIAKKINKLANNSNNSIASGMPSGSQGIQGMSKMSALSNLPNIPNMNIPNMPASLPPGYNNSMMYSYSPTVQNYNFMYPPFGMPNPYQYMYPNYFMNYNPNGYPSVFNQMMGGMPQFPMSSNNPSNNAMRTSLTGSNAVTRATIVEKQTQNQIISQRGEQNETVLPSQASAINAYIQQNNLPFPPNQNYYKIKPSNPSKKKEETMTEEKPKSKQQIKESNEVSQSNQSKKTVEIKMQCVCHNTFKGTTLKCLNCVYCFHIECLNMKNWSKQELENFQCPRCTIRKLDPLNQVKAIFLEEFVNFKHNHHFVRNMKVEGFLNEINQENYIIEARAIRLDGNCSYQISWPDHCSLHTFDKPVDFRPLQNNSSVKKRKEETIIIDKARVISSKMIPFKLELKNSQKQQLKQHRVREQGFFIIGIYLVNKITASELVDRICGSKILEISYEESKSKIHNHFKVNEDIYLEKLSVKLIDPILLNRIRIPARGVFCQHPQCFSLDTFVLMMSKLFHRSWKCPICNYRCYGLYKDTYITDILNKAGPKNEEVEFYPDDTYCIIEYQSDEDDEEAPKANTKELLKKPSSKKQIQEVIIEDDVMIIDNPHQINMVREQINLKNMNKKQNLENKTNTQRLETKKSEFKSKFEIVTQQDFVIQQEQIQKPIEKESNNNNQQVLQQQVPQEQQVILQEQILEQKQPQQVKITDMLNIQQEEK